MKFLRLIQDWSDGDCAIWRRPEESALYVIGVDPVQGRSRTQGDHTCISIWKRNPFALEQVAEWYGRVDPGKQAELIYAFAHAYRGRQDAALLHVERNISDAILMMLRAMDFPEHQFFVPVNIRSKTQSETAQVFLQKHSSNEQMIFDTLVQVADVGGFIPRSEPLWKELYSLKEEKSKRSNTVRVDTGGKDRVIAALWALIAHVQTPWEDAYSRPEQRQQEDPPHGVDRALWTQQRDLLHEDESWGELDGTPEYESAHGSSLYE